MCLRLIKRLSRKKDLPVKVTKDPYSFLNLYILSSSIPLFHSIHSAHLSSNKKRVYERKKMCVTICTSPPSPIQESTCEYTSQPPTL
mmetsp:Transcript_33665/g.40328  ORF Transcript_33665/g.40328 Transcript_33665/m.40328 type:complete len:87 (+) Transcript_33665:68-328(+)